MRILISFCNTSFKSDYYIKNGLSQLAVIDTNDSKVYFIKLPSIINEYGITGLACNNMNIYAITQSKVKPYIIKINKKTFKTELCCKLGEVFDPHSIIVTDSRILICSTGTNSIEAYNKDDFSYEGVYWQHPGTKKIFDTVHLNSICIYENDVIASCVGKRQGRVRWSTIRKGYIISTTSNKTIYSINHPHSVIAQRSDIYCCESRTGQILKNGKPFKKFNNTYLRGLDFDKNTIAIGVSSYRVRSRSLGLLNNPRHVGNFHSKTGLYLLDKKNGKRIYFNLSHYEREIYDVVILGDSLVSITPNINGIGVITKYKRNRENSYISSLINAKEDSDNKLLLERKKYIELEATIDNYKNSNLYNLWKLLHKIR